MRIRLRPFILGLFVCGSQLPAVAQTRPAVQQETRAQTRQRLLGELQSLSKTLNSIVLQARIEDLIPLLSFTVTVGLDSEIPAAAVRQDLQNHGEIYCRIFDTPCARRIYAEREKSPGLSAPGCRLSRCFLSARDTLMKERSARTEVRFYMPDQEEDFGFAYITYMQKQNSRKYGWEAGVMVALERIGANWKISALFPLSY